MWLRRLELEYFRNISGASMDLCPGFNFFYGMNGAGKTAILEAAHVLARGRSFRTQHANDLIQLGANAMVIRADADDEHLGIQRLVFGRARGGGTEVRVNGTAGRRMSQISMLIPMEVMVPSMVDLVFGGPGGRREWLDWGVFHVKHEYLEILRRYVSALRQRNAGLKAIAAGRLRLEDLEPWTAEIVRLGLLVTQARVDHLQDMRTRVENSLALLNGTLEVEICYRQGWPEGQDLANVLGESRQREVKSGITGAGPHRADMELRIHDQLCSVTLSRGQAKVLASALMIAQADLVGASGNRAALFLIDDIGAELDADHRQSLFRALLDRGCQVLATSVEAPEPQFLEECRSRAVFHVEHGRVVAH